MIQAKKQNTYVKFQTDKDGFTKYDPNKDTISTLSTPWGSPTGYSLTSFSSSEERAAWEAEGGGNLISAKDAWLKSTYTDKGMKIPWWYPTRDRIELTDVNKDGVPDQLSVVSYGEDIVPRFEMMEEEAPEIPQDMPQWVEPQPYEVPYYVDVSKATEMLEGGMTIDQIMEKPPLSSEYMYWTDPNDNKEYVMSKQDHKEYLQALAQQKKMIKQRKYDEVFMDVTRGRGPVVPMPKGKRTGRSAGPVIQRVMSGTAPTEADIGGLVKQ